MLHLVASALLFLAVLGPVRAVAAKDTLVLGMTVEPSGLDPTIAAPTTIREVTWGNIFEGLVTIDGVGRIMPQLATSWTISDDGLSYTFSLRPGVRFHNGVPFDSGTVRFTLDRARAEESTNAQKQFFTSIAEIDTPAPLTVVVRLKQPTGMFLDWLAWGDAAIMEPTSAATNRTAPVGTGPFRFAGWRRGDRVELERNPDYWQPGVPRLSRVTFRIIGDPQAQAAALLAGDVDGFPNLAAPELFPQFQNDARFTAVIGSTPRKLVAGLNCAVKPLDDVRVRRALMQAVDRRAVIEGVSEGLGTPIGSHFAPSDPGYVDTTGVLAYDPQRARADLAAAGYPSGLTLTIKTPQMPETARSAQILQGMLAEIGVTLNIVPSEFPAQWIDDVFIKKDFEMTIIDHAEPMDIGIYARPNYYFGYRNPQFDAVIARAEAARDEVGRAEALGEAQRILAADVPALYLFDLPRLNVWRRGLQGMRTDEPLPQMLVRDAFWAE